VVNWQDRHNPQAGGAEIHLHEVFGRLAARPEHRVTLLASGWNGSPRRDSIDGIDVHRVSGRHGFAAAAAPYYRRKLARRNFDVIIEDLNKVPLYAPFWARSPLVLLVHHLFGRTAFEEASLPVAALTWLLERPLQRVYRGVPVQAVSASTADDLVARGFDRSVIRIIENGVDLDFFTPDPDVPRFEQPTALYLGRLKRYKRVDLILRAVALLQAQGTPLQLIVAGRGDAEPELRELSRSLGIEDRVRFAGFVDEAEKRTLFRRSWLHVFASSKEGWGISNLEAAASGTATVASNSPGLRDSVRHGETGFLVPHGDVAALAGRMAELAGSPALRDSLGAGARRFALYYAWDRAADETEAHLAEVIAAGGE
jgi:glycosyltransferase involved in cell wall biosynthesis